MKILIGADIVPTKSNEDLFINGDEVGLVGNDLLEILKTADYRVFNLETPLVSKKTPIAKSGQNFQANPQCIKAIEKMGIDLLTIANNHMMDNGKEGLLSTIQTLDGHNVLHIGAGTLLECQQPVVFEKNNVKIAFFSCCEHEFGCANVASYGVNGFDPYESIDQISQISEQCDFLVVLYHGGKEHYRYPTPRLQKACRSIVDAGADIVICQHSHCIGSEEKYHEGTIVYGQGNFIFDHGDNEFRNSSILVELNVINDKEYKLTYIPFCKEHNHIRLATETEKNRILNGFYERSKTIESGMVQSQYDSFLAYNEVGYLFLLLGIKRGIVHRIINRITKGKYDSYVIEKRLNLDKATALLNLLRCETHNEIIVSCLERFISEKSKIE